MASNGYARIAQALRDEPWAILPGTFEAMLAILEHRELGARLSADEVRARIGDRERPAGVAKSGSVAVLALHGPISQRMNLFSEVSGGTSTELFGRDLDAAIADPEVTAIVLSIDSPGGSVAGVEELALKIYKARSAGKPIVAVSDSLAASAAYWIGSAAHQFVASPSAQVGSIGVVTSHRDVSRAEDAAGVKTTVIAVPAAKVDAHPYAPLSDDALAGILSTIQPFYDLFVKAVARGRGVAASVVREGYGQGRVLAAVPALAAGMVDRIESLTDVLARLSTPQGRRAVLTAQIPPDSVGATVQEPPQATTQEPRRDFWRELLTADLNTTTTEKRK